MVEPVASETRWHFTPDLPIRSAPFLDWPLRPVVIGRHLIRSWSPLRSRLVMLGAAALVAGFLMPSREVTATFAPGWMVAVWARNFGIVLAVAGGIHLWLYVWGRQGDDLRYDARPLGRNRRIFLFKDQVKDNAILTLGPSVVAWTAVECLVLWARANGHAPSVTFAGAPVWFVVWVLLVPWWSVVAFSIGHRVLHFGPAYRHVHSWHHRNVNVGPWSGLAMHPVESLLLFADALIVLVVPSAPLHLYFIMLHHGMGAPMSHTGFHALKLGRRFVFDFGDFHHQLHHRFVECNYGGIESPLDDVFDSFHDGTPQGDAHVARRRRKLSQARRARATPNPQP